MVVGFTCAWGPQVGLGHVARCAAVARELRSLGVATSLRLPAGAGPLPPHLEASFDELITGGASGAVSVFDPAPTGDSIRASVVVIDDGPGRPLDADLVINPNLTATAAGYVTRGGGGVLAGSAHALVDPRYAALRAHRHPAAAPATRFLISCGGADPCGMTERYMLALSDAGLAGEVVAVIGPLATANATLREAAAAGGVELRFEPPDLVELATWTDVALTTLGSTASELAAAGVPNLCCSISPLHRELLQQYAALGVVAALGDASSVSRGQLAQRIEAVATDVAALRGLAETGPRLVDGKGASRVAAAIARLARPLPG